MRKKKQNQFSLRNVSNAFNECQYNTMWDYRHILGTRRLDIVQKPLRILRKCPKYGPKCPNTPRPKCVDTSRPKCVEFFLWIIYILGILEQFVTENYT